MDTLENKIRKLAKDYKHLNLFTTAKDIGSIKLFRNSTDLSRLQQIYLSYLYFYESLMTDIGLKKIDEIVLTDSIYEDAYSFWKRKKGFEIDKKTEKKTDKNLKLVFGKHKR